MRFLEMEMARTNLGSMSVEALLKLRENVGKVLSQKATQLEEQLSKLGGEVGAGRRGRGSAMKGRKVPVKYRDKEGNTWAGERSAACMAAREAQGRREARRLCRSKDSDSSQSFPEESKEAPQEVMG
jgi:hypothetical protein